MSQTPAAAAPLPTSHLRGVFHDHVTFTMLCAPDDYSKDSGLTFETDFQRLLDEFQAYASAAGNKSAQLDPIRQLLATALSAYRAGDVQAGGEALKSIRAMR